MHDFVRVRVSAAWLAKTLSQPDMPAPSTPAAPSFNISRRDKFGFIMSRYLVGGAIVHRYESR